MTWLRHLVVLILFTAIVGAAVLAWHLGALKPVSIQQINLEPMHFIGREHQGAYYKISTLILDLEKWATLHNQPCPQTFGQYLDDPLTTDEDRLRSLGGCVVPMKWSELPTEAVYFENPGGRFVVAEFSGSPAIGPFKVYPKVKTYIEENRLTVTTEVIEVYLVNNDQVTTRYLFRIQ